MNKLKKILYPAIIILFCAFTFQSIPPFGWYQQTLPNLNGRPISDMIFTDSLNGYIVTPYAANDTAYILKTTNGGDNWNIVLRGTTNTIGGFNRVQFINQSTGFACGNFLWKTTNAGLNWFNVNTSGIFPENMCVWNQDTIWIVDGLSFGGGIFRTTNGGLNWTQQYSSIKNPSHIYMYNARIGFADASGCVKTTNSGVNWFFVPGADFSDMYFIDSLRGWKCNGDFEKTTNGGLNWQFVSLPPKGGNIILSRINKFHIFNADTIFGVGSVFLTPGQLALRGVIYKTTNGGITWGYQMPDTLINIFQYTHIQFTDKLHGWTYGPSRGVHTVSGGDTTILLEVKQINSTIPIHYELRQNYPNPFNPTTNIGFRIANFGFVKLEVFDINGRLIETLINQNLSVGEYKVTWTAKNLPSGTYFYNLIINDYSGTKKMMLIK